MRDVQRELESLPAVVGVEVTLSPRARAIVSARAEDPPSEAQLARAIRGLGYVPTRIRRE